LPGGFLSVGAEELLPVLLFGNNNIFTTGLGFFGFFLFGLVKTG
jgi:hypothetical protein